MPRPNRAQGRPGTRVIPAGWAESHAPVLDKTHGTLISVRRPGGTSGPFNDDTGTSPTTPYPAHYSGPAAIAVVTGDDKTIVVAGQEVATVAYRISVPRDASIEPADHSIVGCLVRVDAVDANADDSLVGRVLTVEGLARPSVAWERHMICFDKLTGGHP